jgi:hypothetical protein
MPYQHDDRVNTTITQCVRTEQAVFDQLKLDWPNYSVEAKKFCRQQVDLKLPFELHRAYSMLADCVRRYQPAATVPPQRFDYRTGPTVEPAPAPQQ